MHRRAAEQNPVNPVCLSSLEQHKLAAAANQLTRRDSSQ